MINSQMTPLSNKDDKYDFRATLQFVKETIDINLLLLALGFKASKENSLEFRSSCIIHGGDNTTSFRLNKRTRTWSCFSHACDSLYGKDLIALVRACKGCSFMEAFSFMKDLVGLNDELDSEKIMEYRRVKNRNEFINEVTVLDKPKVHSKFTDESILECNRFLRTNYFIKEDGFTKETLNFFGISGGYIDEHGKQRDVIPIRDVDGSIAGCAFSSTNRNLVYKDKYLFTPNLDKDNILYNLNNALLYIDKYPLIIVEGFKSVWRLYDYGIKNVVACMGTSITQGQKNLLTIYSPHGVVLMFDNDPPGVKGAIRSFEFIDNRFKTDVIFITEISKDGVGLDPADLSISQAHNYLKTYTDIKG